MSHPQPDGAAHMPLAPASSVTPRTAAMLITLLIILLAAPLIGTRPAWAQVEDTGSTDVARTDTASPHTAPSRPAPAAPTPTWDVSFAESLMAEGDYYRAITAYKFLAHHQREHVRQYRYHMGEAYRLLGKYQLALKHFATALHSPNPSPDQKAPIPFVDRVRGQMALIQLAQRAPGPARVTLGEATQLKLTALHPLMLSVADLHEEKWRAASTHAHNAQRRAAVGDAVHRAATQLKGAIDSAEQIPHRSPIIAGLLSGLLPGAGQAYTGHWVDAVQAFALVGAFAFTTTVAYLYESEGNRPFIFTGISLSVTALFHITNIVGAIRTANYHNQKKRHDHFAPSLTRFYRLSF